MNKSWHNPREVTVYQVPAEQEDLKRLERLVALLATGAERFSRSHTTSELLDFTPNVLPNTTNVNEPAKMENE